MAVRPGSRQFPVKQKIQNAQCIEKSRKGAFIVYFRNRDAGQPVTVGHELPSEANVSAALQPLTFLDIATPNPPVLNPPRRLNLF